MTPEKPKNRAAVALGKKRFKSSEEAVAVGKLGGRPSERGFLYCASDQHGLLKLGFSNDPQSRMDIVTYDNTLRPESVERGLGVLKSLWMVPGTLRQEKALHRSLERYAVPGTTEWYPQASRAGELLLSYPTGSWKGLCFTCETMLTEESLYKGSRNQTYCLPCGKQAVEITGEDATEAIFTCLRCGHQWLRRSLTKEPKQCPKCHSYYWSRQRKLFPIPHDPSSDRCRCAECRKGRA